MAKIQFTAIVAGIRGKLAGTVFSRNASANYVRTKTTPTNPRTPAQQLARFRFGNLSQGWRALTQAMRDSWKNLADNTPQTDVFGNTQFLTGLQMYIRRNFNLLLAGQALLEFAPANSDLPVFEFDAPLDAGIAGGDILLGQTIDGNTDSPAGYAVVVEGTGPLSPGATAQASDYRIIRVAEPNQDFQQITISTYAAQFGMPVEGQSVGFRLSIINLATGQRSPYLVLEGNFTA